MHLATRRPAGLPAILVALLFVLLARPIAGLVAPANAAVMAAAYTYDGSHADALQRQSTVAPAASRSSTQRAGSTRAQCESDLERATRFAAEDIPEEVSLYRGVASDNPGYNDALNGIARPRGGPATAAEHNLGDTRSGFTSWTTDPDVAKGMSYPGGVVMRIAQSSVASRLVQSPDLFDESEILIRGLVTGAELLP